MFSHNYLTGQLQQLCVSIDGQSSSPNLLPHLPTLPLPNPPRVQTSRRRQRSIVSL